MYGDSSAIKSFLSFSRADSGRRPPTRTSTDHMSVGSNISEYAPQGVSQTTPFAIPDWLECLVVARHSARTGGGRQHSGCDRTRQTEYSPGRALRWRPSVVFT